MDMGQTQHIPDAALADYGETLARQLRLEGTVSARRLSREYRACLARLRRQCERFQARGAAPGSGHDAARREPSPSLIVMLSPRSEIISSPACLPLIIHFCLST